MHPILTILTAILLSIGALLDAPAEALFSTSRLLTLVLLTLGFVYVLWTLSRVGQAAR